MDEELDGIDMDNAISGADLGLDTTDEPETVEIETVETAASETADPVVATTTETAPAVPVVRDPPKSWAKDKHEVWSKMPPEAQEYYVQREKQMLDGLEGYKTDAGFGKQLREAVAPFQQMLDQNKIDVPKAVQYLLGAHQRLSYGTPESRKAAYDELGRSLGLVEGEKVDPALKAVQDELAQIKSGLTARQQAELDATKARVSKEVEDFAADKANPYFDEVADDMTPFLNAGVPLKDAYEKAVWANPVTRAKEQARIQAETEKKLRENARLDALKGKKASSTNVRTRDTTKAPTEPLGTMTDTMTETYREIQSRTH